MPDDVLQRLAATIRSRRSESTGKSYTKELLDAGPERCAKKLGEEATETVIAALGADKAALAREAADLIYHLLVLLESRQLAWDDVLDTWFSSALWPFAAMGWPALRSPRGRMATSSSLSLVKVRGST